MVGPRTAKAILATVTGLAIPMGQPGTLAAQDAVPEYPALEVRIWMDRSEDAVLQRGDRVRVYYRVSEDAFVAVFHINTDGRIQLVYPGTPETSYYLRGSRDYRLLFPRASQWYVDDNPGVGYFFAVASPTPFDFSGLEYSYYEQAWDLSRVGRDVFRDPYVAMDEYVALLVPDWEYADYALDFTSYHVGERYEYPRFLCYDCHGYRPYYSWNPYHYTCVNFRLWIYTDPYYYPAYRYSGRRVVFTRPVVVGSPRFVFKERGDGEPGTPTFVQRPTGAPGVEGTTPRRRVEPPPASTPRRVPLIPERGDAGAGVERRRPGATGGAVRPGSGAVSPGRAPVRERPSAPARGEVQTGQPRLAPVVPPRSGAGRPSLERRPPREETGSSARPSDRSRPPAAVRPPSGSSSSARPSRPPSGSSSSARPKRPPDRAGLR